MNVGRAAVELRSSSPGRCCCYRRRLGRCMAIRVELDFCATRTIAGAGACLIMHVLGVAKVSEGEE